MNILLKIVPSFKFRETRVLVFMQTGEGPCYALYRAYRKKGKAEMEPIFGYTRDREILARQNIPAGMPVILSFQGEGLVQRIFTGTKEEAVKHIPNFKASEYVIQYRDLEDGRTLLALSRKDRIEKAFEDLQKINIFPSALFLGFSGFLKFSGAIAVTKSQLIVGSHSLQLEGEKVLSVEKISRTAPGPERQETKTDEDIEAMGTAISFFINGPGRQEILTAIPTFNLKELVAAKINRSILRYALPALLAILLVNFLVFDHLQLQQQASELTRTSRQELARTVDQLKKEIDAEQKFTGNANLGEEHAFAFYADRLAALRTPGIRFSELTIDPVRKKTRPGEKIDIERGIIILKGSCTNEESFSKFLVGLKNAQWTVEIIKQVYTFSNEAGSASFEMEVTYKNNMQ